MPLPQEQSAQSRLLELFDELVDCSEADQQQRLVELQVMDADMALALRRMLRADAASGVLDREPVLLDALATATVAVADRSGDSVGPYRLLRLLGRGGMGEVYLAERVSPDFQQRVAVKLLRRGMDSQHLLQRFSRERRILAQLEHPDIARLLDGGVAADGSPYFAMEFVDGHAITEHASRHSLNIEQRLQLLLRATEAVAYAQSRLIVHRDIKPSNILVDHQGRLYVLDFGIAKLLDEEADEQLTATGGGLLTPAYAAPEQLRGEAVTTASDVFALGGVLFELLAGRPPRSSRGDKAGNWQQALDIDRFEPPSLQLARRSDQELLQLYGSQPRERLVRELRGDLDLIVATALHADSSRRYASAAALAQDLHAYLQGRPIAARADTRAYRLRRFIARHRVGVGSACALFLSVLAGLAITLWQANLAQQQARRADAEALRAQTQAARADKVKAFLSSIFSQVDPLRRDVQGERSLRQAFDEALARIDTEFLDDPATRIDLLDDFGEIRAGQGDFDGAAELFERALTLAEQHLGPEAVAVAEASLNLGVLSAYRGRSQEGQAFLERAVAILQPQAEAYPRPLMAALSGLSNVLHGQGRAQEAIALLRRVLALRQQTEADNRKLLAGDMQNLATALIVVGEFTEAAPLVSQARQIIEELNGNDSPAMIPLWWLQQKLDYQRGDAAAEGYSVQRQWELSRQHFPDDHWWKARAITELGYRQALAGNTQAALDLITDAQSMLERLRSPLQVDALRRRGQVLLLAGDAPAAVVAFSAAAAACAEFSTRRFNPTCLLVAAQQAQMQTRQGEAERALEAARQLLAQTEQHLGRRSEAYIEALAAQAAALQALGREAEAGAARKTRQGLLRSLYPPEHPLLRGGFD